MLHCIEQFIAFQHTANIVERWTTLDWTVVSMEELWKILHWTVYCIAAHGSWRRWGTPAWHGGETVICHLWEISVFLPHCQYFKSNIYIQIYLMIYSSSSIKCVLFLQSYIVTCCLGFAIVTFNPQYPSWLQNKKSYIHPATVPNLYQIWFL